MHPTAMGLILQFILESSQFGTTEDWLDWYLVLPAIIGLMTMPYHVKMLEQLVQIVYLFVPLCVSDTTCQQLMDVLLQLLVMMHNDVVIPPLCE